MLVTTGLVLVAGEMTTSAYIDIPAIARGAIRAIGYTDSSYGIDGESCGVLVAIGQQSPDIALGVDTGGAGDQGMMFGYASDETPELMPAPIMLAHRLSRRLAGCARMAPALARPDGKAQVTLEYEDGAPVHVHTVVSAQHAPDVTLAELRARSIERVITPVMPAQLFDPERPSSTSIPPAGSSSAGRTGTPA